MRDARNTVTELSSNDVNMQRKLNKKLDPIMHEHFTALCPKCVDPPTNELKSVKVRLICPRLKSWKQAKVHHLLDSIMEQNSSTML